MLREIITINEDKCTGCGECVPGCPEGALQIIDGKARLVSDLMCDGLGACIGHCPEAAITIEKREAEKYDERKVMENIVKAGTNTIRAHLRHLHDHGQKEYHAQALAYLQEKNIPVPGEKEKDMEHHHEGCPGSRSMDFATPAVGPAAAASSGGGGDQASGLTHWPIQLHLISPHAPHYQGADLLLAADCVAFTLGNFHRDWLQGKKLAIACPKLDEGQEVYTEKLVALIDEAKVNTLTVLIMQVPCCRGLLALAQEAAGQAKRKVPIKAVVVSLQGGILEESWV